MNLPNSISIARIVASPLLAVLPFIPSVTWRIVAFVLYLVTAISDHIDGEIARNRGLVTDFGKLLDPLADKLLLLATFIPMFVLQASPTDPLLQMMPALAERSQYAFITWGIEAFWFPWWVFVLIIGREAFMTWFRGFAKKRGEVIGAQRLGKWKAGFQYTWIGASYCWFWMRLLQVERGWDGPVAIFLAKLVGGIGVITLTVAFLLTGISLLDYLRRHRMVFVRRNGAATR